MILICAVMVWLAYVIGRARAIPMEADSRAPPALLGQWQAVVRIQGKKQTLVIPVESETEALRYLLQRYEPRTILEVKPV